MFKVLAKRLYGKLFADKGYISQKLFDSLFEDGIQLVTGLRVNMKNKLMPFYDRMMLARGASLKPSMTCLRMLLKLCIHDIDL